MFRDPQSLEHLSAPLADKVRQFFLLSPVKEAWAGKGSIPSLVRGFLRSKDEGVGWGEGDLRSKCGCHPHAWEPVWWATLSSFRVSGPFFLLLSLPPLAPAGERSGMARGLGGRMSQSQRSPPRPQHMLQLGERVS